MLLTPAEIKPKSFESRWNSLLFFFFSFLFSLFTRGGCASCLRACLGARLLPQSNYQYPNLSEGADRIGGQLRGDKECPFSGVTKSGRVWRKVPESDAQNMRVRQTSIGCFVGFICSIGFNCLFVCFIVALVCSLGSICSFCRLHLFIL